MKKKKKKKKVKVVSPPFWSNFGIYLFFLPKELDFFGSGGVVGRFFFGGTKIRAVKEVLAAMST